MWTIIQESCRFTEKNFSHCFSLLLHPVPMGVGWRAIRAPTDTFLVFFGNIFHLREIITTVDLKMQVTLSHSSDCKRFNF